MDFNKLMKTMRDLDAPSKPAINEQVLNEMPDVAPVENGEQNPSMSFNINAHGTENIADMLRLFTKVNPDMLGSEPAGPTVEPEQSLGSIAPDNEPDIEIEPMGDEGPGMEIEPIDDSDPIDLDEPESEPAGDLPSADLDAEEEPEESWANQPDEQEQDVNFMLDKITGGLNDKDQKTYPKVAGGDNPMGSMETEGEGEVNFTATDGPRGKEISADTIRGLENIEDLDELKQRAISLIKASKIKMAKKAKMVRNVMGSYDHKNIISLLWNSVLASGGDAAIGSSWPGRFEGKNNNKVSSIKEQLWAALNKDKVNEAKETFDTQLAIEGEHGEELHLGVNYNVSGKYTRATQYEPEEFPEIEITKIVDLDRKSSVLPYSADIDDDITDEIFENERLYEQIIKHIEDELNQEPEQPNLDDGQREALGDTPTAPELNSNDLPSKEASAQLNDIKKLSGL